MTESDARIGSKWCLVLAASALALVVAGCGVKSAPKFPKESVYPRIYPEPLPALKTVPQAESQDATGPGTPPSGIYQYPNPRGYRPPDQ